MDIDFHFGTIYVLSRWAGFRAENALTIATSSQFVDDNVPKVLEDHAGLRSFFRASGHGLVDNIKDIKHDFDIWVPFHFLPGLEGEYPYARLICRKHSVMAKAVAERIRGLSLDGAAFNQQVMELGILLHVYADTWAHQGFSGVLSQLNEVENPRDIYPLPDAAERERNVWIHDRAPGLGHAQAIHWPDRPYASWKVLTKFPDGRANWDEFMEAAAYIYRLLSALQGNERELDDVQRDMLLNGFQNTTAGDCEQRNRLWIQRIGENAFGFDDFSERDLVGYSSSFILDDPDFCRAFYDALNEYYVWVRAGLEEQGVVWDDFIES